MAQIEELDNLLLVKALTLTALSYNGREATEVARRISQVRHWQGIEDPVYGLSFHEPIHVRDFFSHPRVSTGRGMAESLTKLEPLHPGILSWIPRPMQGAELTAMRHEFIGKRADDSIQPPAGAIFLLKLLLPGSSMPPVEDYVGSVHALTALITWEFDNGKGIPGPFPVKIATSSRLLGRRVVIVINENGITFSTDWFGLKSSAMPAFPFIYLRYRADEEG